MEVVNRGHGNTTGEQFDFLTNLCKKKAEVPGVESSCILRLIDPLRREHPAVNAGTSWGAACVRQYWTAFGLHLIWAVNHTDSKMPPRNRRRELPPPSVSGPLLPWLLHALQPSNRTRVKQLLRNGHVFVNGTCITRHDYLVQPGDRITIAQDRLPSSGTENTTGLKIVYEDEALVIIDKPSGLLTVASESEKLATAFVRLRAELAARRAGRPFVVHRLDRETSGLLVFARSTEVCDRIQSNWEYVQKTYLAIVEGVPPHTEGVIENFLTEGRNLRVRITPPRVDSKLAVTRYRLVKRSERYSLVEVGLDTGRKHQIRVHLAGLGCPVIGDASYGATTNPARRLGLHAWRLAFDHPLNGTRVVVESALPAVLQRIVRDTR